MLSDAGRVVYVGQSSDICARLLRHRSEGRRRFSTALFYHMPNSAESDRLWVEGMLICAYRPSTNRAWNVGMSDGRCWEIGFGRKRGKRA